VDFKHKKTMSDKMTESVARLYRAGSENSMQTQKLREAVDRLLTWIKENLEDPNTILPTGYMFYPSGEFVRKVNCTVVLKVAIGQKHGVDQLQSFAKLIADGFLEDLCERIESRAKGFETAASKLGGSAQKIEQFLESGRVGFVEAHRKFFGGR
jgi:hypothetical protein